MAVLAGFDFTSQNPHRFFQAVDGLRQKVSFLHGFRRQRVRFHGLQGELGLLLQRLRVGAERKRGEWTVVRESESTPEPEGQQ